MWALVLLSVMNTTLLRYIRQKPSSDLDRARLAESGRRLRRNTLRARRTGYVILLVGFAAALPLLLLIGVKYALQSLVFGVLIHFGLLQPAWLICELYGRMFERLGTVEGNR
jgi:hypothetical protein